MRRRIEYEFDLFFSSSNFCSYYYNIVYKKTEKLLPTLIGEVFGTGIIGGMIAYPIAAFVMGNSSAALFTFVVPFLISTCGGTIGAFLILMVLKGTNVLPRMKAQLDS